MKMEKQQATNDKRQMADDYQINHHQVSLLTTMKSEQQQMHSLQYDVVMIIGFHSFTHSLIRSFIASVSIALCSAMTAHRLGLGSGAMVGLKFMNSSMSAPSSTFFSISMSAATPSITCETTHDAEEKAMGNASGNG
jgi:hypothetical protein